MRNKKIECVWRRNRILSVSKNTPYICKYNSKRNDKISNKNNWIKKNYKHDAKKLIITNTYDVCSVHHDKARRER